MPTSSSSGVTDALDTTPAADGYRMPAEFEPHAGCWMAWPERLDNWRLGAAPAQRAFAAVAEAINASEPVTMTASSSQLERCRSMLSPSIRVVELSSDDAWMRDIGPSFLTKSGARLRGVDWQFNAWGGLYPDYERDDGAAAAVLEIEEAERYRAPLVLEGGSIHLDGEGTVLVTEECLLNPNRNPKLSKTEIERALYEYLGCEKAIWLGRGLPGDETDGHIDNLACFIAPGRVLLSFTDAVGDPQSEVSADALERLRAATDARGGSLDVILMPTPGPLAIEPDEAAGIDLSTETMPRRAGEPMAGSYVNFYIANSCIVHPLLDERRDEQAAQVLAECFPNREIVGLPAREILLGGGNIHCITQQVPLVT
jgi:agmatine deiminase